MVQFVSQRKLMEGVGYRTLYGSWKNRIRHVACHTNRIQPGGAFVCIAGTQGDGHRYVSEALERGAALIVVERITEPLKTMLAEGSLPERVVVVQVSDSRRAYGKMCRNYFCAPDMGMQIIGITGTKGKTTTSYMLRAMLSTKYRTGLIGTTGAYLEGEYVPMSNTTPDAYELYELLYRMQKRGITHVVMEVSSQGLKQHRVEGLRFSAAAYTNLSCDHLGKTEHETMREYAYWKGELAKQSCAYLVNGDDAYSLKSGEDHPNLHVFSLKNNNLDGKIRLKWEDIEKDTHFGARLFLEWISEDSECLHAGAEDFGKLPDEQGEEIFSPSGYYLPNAFSFNRENVMTAMGLCMLVEGKIIGLKQLSTLEIPGRMQIVYVSETLRVMIDYAHNEQSLEKALTALRGWNPKRLVCLFGCGGERARERRVRMGQVSGRLADLTIVTQDNSRREPLETILQDILSGICRETGDYIVIPDRREAITYAVQYHQKGDCVLLAGKGHENYMITGDTVTYFSEADIVREAVQGISR